MIIYQNKDFKPVVYIQKNFWKFKWDFRTYKFKNFEKQFDTGSECYIGIDEQTSPHRPAN